MAAGEAFSMGLKGGALPGIISASWSTSRSYDGDRVSMTAQTEGLDGELVTFDIYERDLHEGSLNEFVTTIDAGPVQDGTVSAYWNAQWQEDGLLGIWDPPEFYFTVSIGDLSRESDLLVVDEEREAVIRPMIGLPVIQKRGEAFQIEIKSGAVGLTLADFAVTVALDLSSAGSETTLARGPLTYDSDRDLWVLTATLPENLATGLHDLKVTVDGRELVRPNAVSVISEFSNDPLICYITDIHADFDDMLPVVEDSGFGGENWNERTQYFSARLREARDLHADFILIGGDNVDWSTEANWQWFYETLLQSEVPTFVQLGNHDYRDSRTDIRTGLPPVSGWLEIDFVDPALEFFWDNICSPEHFMHYSFDYGDKVHVIGLNSGPDNFSQPDAITDILGWDYIQGKGLTNEQMGWLANDLSDSQSNVIFMHHPVFGGEAAPYDDAVISNRDAFRKLCRDSRTAGRDIVAVFSGHVHLNQIWPADGTSYITADQACRAPLSVLTRLSQDLYFAGGIDLAYTDFPGGFAESGLYFEVTAEQP